MEFLTATVHPAHMTRVPTQPTRGTARGGPHVAVVALCVITRWSLSVRVGPHGNTTGWTAQLLLKRAERLPPPVRDKDTRATLPACRNAVPLPTRMEFVKLK